MLQIKVVTGSPSHRNQARKRNEKHSNWKKEVKPSLFVDNMILYIENPKDSIKTTVRINKFSKCAKYRITQIYCISIH